MREGRAVAVHCRAGIGRSSMIVASALIRNGLSPESAFRAIEESRGCNVPDTPEQKTVGGAKLPIMVLYVRWAMLRAESEPTSPVSWSNYFAICKYVVAPTSFSICLICDTKESIAAA